MKKILLTIAAVISCAALFTACNKDDNKNNGETKNLKLFYDFYVSIPDAAEDQQDVLAMVMSAPNNQGVNQDVVFSDYIDMLESKNEIKDLPRTITVSFKQTLREDRPVKDSYKLGLNYKLTIKTLDDDNLVYDMQEKANEETFTVSAANLNSMFPKTLTFKVDADKKGKITITNL